ncbi:MAG: sigma-54 dependent transcriptional regulator [Pseudomonadota bacterium]|nr:sigma-54 dependent transcriptional regulator [Pseudomonadota bacterium]
MDTITELRPRRSQAPSREMVIGLLDACTKVRKGRRPAEWSQLDQNASACLEATYRIDADLLDRPMTVKEYARLIDRVACGGCAKSGVLSAGNGAVRLVNTECPLTDYQELLDSGLCEIGFKILGNIAARNFGYAKVAINRHCKGIARHCELAIYLDRDTARNRPGVEYCDISESGFRGAPGGQGTHEQLPQLVACSAAIKRLLVAIDIVAPTPATVLVTGETGVGKELVARRLHALSGRAEEDFVAVNCGAIPEELVDSTLFGHEKGAFTGAFQRRAGYFERAQDGTLFLDEIDSLTPSAQGRLLRVLQEGKYERVGGTQVLRTNARIIAATNKSLCEAVRRGEFRNDLLFRINVVNLHIPPLRESPGAIPRLVEHILGKLRMRYGKPVVAVSPNVMQQLCAHDWPGNVRELENVLERSYLFASGEILENIALNVEIEAETALADVAEPPAQEWQEYKRQLIEQAEMRYLEHSLRRYRGDVSAIANNMRLTSRSIYLKLSKYRLDLGQYRT